MEDIENPLKFQSDQDLNNRNEDHDYNNLQLQSKGSRSSGKSQNSSKKISNLENEKLNLNETDILKIDRKQSIQSNQSKRSQKSIKSQNSSLKPPRPPTEGKKLKFDKQELSQNKFNTDHKSTENETFFMNSQQKMQDSKKNLIDHFGHEAVKPQKQQNIKLKPLKHNPNQVQSDQKIFSRKQIKKNDEIQSNDEEINSSNSSPQKQPLKNIKMKNACNSTLGKSFWNLPLSEDEYVNLDIKFHQKEAYDLIENDPVLSKQILPQYDTNRDARWQFEGEEFQTDKNIKELKVLTLTYNMKGSIPVSPEDMDLFLNTNNIKHHLIAIGFQECSNTIGQSFFCSSKQKWECQLNDHLQPQGYYQVTSTELNAQYLVIYAHKCIKDQINTQRINKYSENTGFMNLFANKGGIAIKLNIGQDTYLFISSHFASGQKSHQKRNENHKVIARSLSRGRVKEINQNIKKQSQFSQSNKIQPSKISPQIDQSIASAPANRQNYFTSTKLQQETPLSELFDYIFWVGDLNYRVDESVLQDKVIDIITKKGFYKLLKQDQLVNQRIKGEIFNGFEEGMILFPPTYKLQLYENIYTDIRIPGWTDRILYSGIKKKQIKQVNYECGINVFGSDHRPVFAQFLIKYNPIDQIYTQINTSSSHCCIC